IQTSSRDLLIIREASSKTERKSPNDCARAGDGTNSELPQLFCDQSALMKKATLFLSIICASGLTMVSIYNTVIDAASWNSDIPMSIQTARAYFRPLDPRR